MNSTREGLRGPVATGPTDLPGRREPGGDADYSPVFEAGLARFIPDAIQRAYFVRDGIEFRLQRAIELQRITEVDGYLITEDGLAGVPALIIWLSISGGTVTPPRYTLESVHLAESHAEAEDDT